MSIRGRNWLGLLACVIGAGLASIGLRQDSNWDLQNYHLYNVWAFVHDRFGIDWAPAQLQSFYSPYLDLPFHALLSADAPPRMIAVMLAVPTGIAWFFFARTVLLLFAPVAPPLRRHAIMAAIFIGITAPMSISLIGLTMNDWFVAAFVMTAVFVVIRGLTAGRLATNTLLLAGALVGLGAGLKLTGSIYGVGLLVGLLLVQGTVAERLRATIYAGLAMAAAFAATTGPWMFTLYRRFGNPLFPYFNDVFRSPWADPVPFSATSFGPDAPAEWLVFPYMMLWKLQGYVAEPEFRDARPAVLYSLVLVVVALALLRRHRDVEHSREAARSPTTADAWRFIAGFFIATFVAWAVLYRVYRYLIPLELLGGALIVHMLLRIVPARRAASALLVTVALVVVTAKFPTWWRQPFGAHFLAVEMPPVKPGSLVLLVSAEPMSYVLPSFPADARFAGLDNNFNDPWRHNKLQQAIADAIRDHLGPMYSLAVPPRREIGVRALAAVQLERIGCAEIVTNLRVSPLELCELRRIR
ncbi:MAG: hypothetical protein ABI777_04520 [Betaproteobacteria bacterium]